jgi:hypothetical protein
LTEPVKNHPGQKHSACRAHWRQESSRAGTSFLFSRRLALETVRAEQAVVVFHHAFAAEKTGTPWASRYRFARFVVKTALRG